MTALQLQVCVVAHNEQTHILACLKSIETALTFANIEQYAVHIINNGSSDNTQIVVDSFCVEKPHWFAHEVSLGDKANAWNLGIYQYANADTLTVYVDGDCKMSANTLRAFIDAHESQPKAYIYAAIPSTKGSGTEQVIRNTLKGNALSGNLFALSERFIKTVRQKLFKLPVGLIGDDSLLAWVSSHDFKLSNGVIDGLLVGVENAKFEYHRLTPTSWSNITLYIRRLKRYSLRHLQQKCIREFLNKHNNFELLPVNIEELYVLHKAEHIRTDNFINRYFDNIAAKQINKILKDKTL